MFNLLPESLRDKIIKEYKLRRFVVSLLFIVFIEMSFLVFMMPSLVISYYREKEFKLRVESLEKSPLISNINSIKPVIRSLNNDLITIDKNLSYQEAIPLIDLILSKRINLIHITAISYSGLPNSSAGLAIEGVSDTRDSLVAFKKSLEDSKVFKSVDSPISNLAKDKNIEFTMTLISNPKI